MAFRPILDNKTQTQWLLDYFKRYSSISPQEAAGEFKIRSLSRRINDLERLGYRFAREPRKDFYGQRYVRYHFLGKAPATVNPAEIAAHVERRAA